MGKLPLAWLQLKREASRLAVALAGIAFADILMFMQLGFRDSLYYSNVRFHNSLQGEIVLINRQTSALLSMKRFSQNRLYQALDIAVCRVSKSDLCRLYELEKSTNRYSSKSFGYRN